MFDHDKAPTVVQTAVATKTFVSISALVSLFISVAALGVSLASLLIVSQLPSSSMATLSLTLNASPINTWTASALVAEPSQTGCVFSCSNFEDYDSCLGQEDYGCTWDGEAMICNGENTDKYILCSDIYDEYTCNAANCTWNYDSEICEGSYSYCGAIQDYGACQYGLSSFGCSWVWVEANPTSQATCPVPQLTVKNSAGNVLTTFELSNSSPQTKTITNTSADTLTFSFTNDCCLGWNGSSCTQGGTDIQVSSIAINGVSESIQRTLFSNGNNFTVTYSSLPGPVDSGTVDPTGGSIPLAGDFNGVLFSDGGLVMQGVLPEDFDTIIIGPIGIRVSANEAGCGSAEGGATVCTLNTNLIGGSHTLTLSSNGQNVESASFASPDIPPTCGNNTIDAGELCDRFKVGAATCSSASDGDYDSGILGCSMDCQHWDTSRCFLQSDTAGVVDLHFYVNLPYTMTTEGAARLVSSVNAFYRGQGIDIMFRVGNIIQDYHGACPEGGDRNVIICIGPDKGGDTGGFYNYSRYIEISSQKFAREGFSKTTEMAIKHELGHYLGLRDLYWLTILPANPEDNRPIPSLPRADISTDIMFSSLSGNTFIAENKAILKYNVEKYKTNGADGIVNPFARTPQKIMANINCLGQRFTSAPANRSDVESSLTVSYRPEPPRPYYLFELPKITTSPWPLKDFGYSNLTVFYFQCLVANEGGGWDGGYTDYWYSTLNYDQCFIKAGGLTDKYHPCALDCSVNHDWCTNTSATSQANDQEYDCAGVTNYDECQYGLNGICQWDFDNERCVGYNSQDL
ncbi:MAG: hypothetical protein A2744_02550 [Candidatus Buchananbacteria bacterium RIFCSPHIGHO2_01_FULL_44_11]|nr:MAG: hypothetical protein A2744_02550 [Candidatus Buchananbacteria bacterium RIFCSPHIGHO2_01_FULL_44_11]